MTRFIGLHDAEREHLKNKTFPNYALMKIAALEYANDTELEEAVETLGLQLQVGSKVKTKLAAVKREIRRRAKNETDNI